MWAISAGPTKPFGMGRLCGLGLHDRLATGAGQTQAGDLVYDVVAGLLEDDSLDHFLTCLTILQLFDHICAQHFEVAPAIGTGVTGDDLDLSRLRSGLSPHLCGLSLECQGAFVAKR